MNSPSKVAQIQNVQALRGFACCVVVIDHLVQLEVKATPGYPIFLHWIGPVGFSSVDLFFAISGFVIITSTWSSFEKPAIGSNFLLRRLLRVFPIYWIVLVPLAILSIVAPSLVLSTQAVRPNILASFALLPQTGLPILTVSWSLVYEMYFYYLYTFAIARPRPQLKLVVGGWVLFTIALAVIFRNSENPYLNFLGSTLSFEFIFGMIIGWLLLREHRFRCCVTVIAVGVTTIFIIAMVHPGHGFQPFGQMRFVLSGIPTALILYGFVGLEKNHVFVIGGPLILLGDASYSMYLWHVPIIATIAHLSAHWPILHNPIIHILWLSASFAVIVGGSILLYRLIERPLLRQLSQLMRPKAVTVFTKVIENARKEQVS